MSALERLIELLWQPKPRSTEAAMARDLSLRIGQRADELNEHLKTYQRARDPFAALMADLYNRDQLDKLHRSIRP
jgi:hypothetical protein